MKKFVIPLLIVAMVVSIILAGCAPTPTPEAPTPPQPVEQPPPVPPEPPPEVSEPAPASPPVVLPKPGEWAASIEIGELRFTVSPDGTGIAKIFVHIPGEFKCGVATATNSQLTYENPSLWPITGGRFTVEALAGRWDIVIQGKFDETGTQASGTWEISAEGTTCQEGTWEASAP